VDTEVSKQSDVGRNETMVGSSKVVVGHNRLQSKIINRVMHIDAESNALCLI